MFHPHDPVYAPAYVFDDHDHDHDHDATAPVLLSVAPGRRFATLLLLAATEWVDGRQRPLHVGIGLRQRVLRLYHDYHHDDDYHYNHGGPAAQVRLLPELSQRDVHAVLQRRYRHGRAGAFVPW